MKAIQITNLIAFILLAIGGLNWLLIGIFDFNLVAAIFGTLVVISRIIYSLVGLSAIWLVVSSIWLQNISFPKMNNSQM